METSRPNPAEGTQQDMEETYVADTPVAQDTSPGAKAKTPGQGKSSKSDQRKVTQLGDFKLIKKLGQGGMGEVFLAHQISLDRKVALKVMNKQFSTNELFVKRFIREAQTMARLDHPNIVRGFAVGEDQGLVYLAMELIVGKSMQDWMKERGKLSVGDTLYVGMIVAEALKHAHEMNLVHRDIKPDNILVTDKGVVKVSDMGLAKITDEDMSMTQSGTGLGTPYYMPPEQARNAKHVDARSDIYALGCTLYNFLTGALPFNGTSAMELILAKEKGSFTRARQLNSEIPERLDLMLDKMLAKDPKSRYQTCDEVIKDLSSLQLHNMSLSFCDAVSPTAALSTPTRSPSIPDRSLSASSPPGKSAATPGNSAAGVSKTDADAWYVLQPGPDGKLKKVRMSTHVVKQQVVSGSLDHRTGICAEVKGKYRPLGTVPEFAQALRDKASRSESERKAKEFNSLYQDIDREQRWHRWRKWFRNSIENFTGLLSLILYLAAISGVGFAIYYFWPTLMEMVRSRTGG